MWFGELNLNKWFTVLYNFDTKRKIFMINKCSQCGICCRLFLVNLTEEEYRSGKYKTQFEKFSLMNDFHSANACGANILKQKKDGSCIYLKEKKCSVHKIRPRVCREFFCTSKLKRFKKMIKQIEKEKYLLPQFGRLQPR